MTRERQAGNRRTRETAYRREYSGERRRAFSIVGKIEVEKSSGLMVVRIDDELDGEYS